MSRPSPARSLAAPLILVLVVAVSPAWAGLTFEWVGVNVFSGKNALDAGLISGRLELRDGLELGDFVTRGDIQSFSFDDSRIDFWDAASITKAQLWAGVPGLGSKTKSTKKDQISLSLRLDASGASELFPNGKKKQRGQKVSLELESASSKDIKKIEDLFLSPLVPVGTDLWTWEMKTKSHFRLSGIGYWRLVPTPTALPEPSGLLLFLAGLAGAHTLYRRGGARKSL